MADEKKLSIMIVDDDKFLLGMYALKFQNNGYDVEAINGSPDALVRLRSGAAKPDILVLDIIMPYMTGLELLKIIKTEKLAEQSVVVMLTNQGQSSDINAAQALGVEGYIVKASTIPSEVLVEVRKIYDEHRGSKVAKAV
jgi:CheY-like chemotaxis protein